MEDIYWAHKTLLREVLDEQAPLKQKVPKAKPPLYMNFYYRKIIYKKYTLETNTTIIKPAKTGKTSQNGETLTLKPNENLFLFIFKKSVAEGQSQTTFGQPSNHSCHKNQL